MSSDKEQHPLIRDLRAHATDKDRGVLAALRSGLGKRPGEAPRMFPFIAKHLGSLKEDDPMMRATFLTASLFALHPVNEDGKSLAAALKTTVGSKHGLSGIESRLTAALNADPEDLEHHLTSLVRLCQSGRAGLDWERFFWDAFHLMRDEEPRSTQVRLNWAKDFWAQPRHDADNTENETETL